jgi:hypothetical protein
MNGDPVLGRKPSISRDAEQSASLDHLTAAFGKRRNPELEAASDGLTAPRRLFAAAILFPDPAPGEVGALPSIPKQYA